MEVFKDTKNIGTTRRKNMVCDVCGLKGILIWLKLAHQMYFQFIDVRNVQQRTPCVMVNTTNKEEHHSGENLSNK
jgi:hypothetical protein